MDLLLTRSLLAVAQARSIAEAAARLGLSQSALSRRIQQLEAQIGAELLERRGRRATLTEAGRLFLSEGASLLARYDRLRETIREHLELDAGTVRIGGGATAVSYLLPAAMARFRKTHPGVRFRLEEGGSRQIEAAVLEERIELGIVTLPTESEEIEVKPLTSDRIVLVAGGEHPLLRRRRVKPKDLSGADMIGFPSGSAIREHIDAALRRARIEMNVVMEVRSVAAILGLLDVTGGLAFISELGAQGRPCIEVQGLAMERKLGWIKKRGRPLSAAAQAFARELHEIWARRRG